MTDKEEKSLANLHTLLRDINSANQKFREDIKTQVDAINSKTEKKHMPIYLEQDILQVAQKSIHEAIKTVLTGYNSPLSKLVESVINENSVELRALVADSFTKVIRTDDFKASIVSAFSHKVAKTIISNNEGLFDKVSNELKQDASFKAKMIVMTASVVEECLQNRKDQNISKSIG